MRADTTSHTSPFHVTALARRALLAFVMLVTLCAGAGAQTVIGNLDGRESPAAVKPGSPAGSYGLSDIEQINVYNGRLGAGIPLLKVGGRGGASYTITQAITQPSLSVDHTLVAFFGTNPGPGGGNDTHLTWNSNVSQVHKQLLRAVGFGPGVMHGRHAGEGVVRCQTNEDRPSHYGSTFTFLEFTAPDGTEYALYDEKNEYGGDGCQGGRNRGSVFSSRDGAGLTFVSDWDIFDRAQFDPVNHYPDIENVFGPYGYLLMPDGTRYRVENGLVKWIADRNGNRLKFTYDAAGKLTEVKDPLDRVITFQYNYPDGDYGVCNRILYRGFGGEQRVIRVALNRPAPGGQTAAYAWLPDGVRRFAWFTNSYGELTRLELPTGAAAEYTHQAGVRGTAESGQLGQSEYMLRTVASQGGEVSPPPPPKMFFYRRLTERRLYESGGTGTDYTSRTTYSRPESGNCYMQSGVISTCEFVADEDYVQEDTYADGGAGPLASVRHYFHGRPAADMYATLHLSQLYPTETLKGRERQTDVLDGGTVVRSVTNTWVERPRGPVLTSSTTTLSDAGLSSTRTFGYDQYNNRTDAYEYGFDGGLIRRAHTDYETASAYTSATAGAHLRGLPKEQWVSTDADGLQKVARTVYAYDQYDLTDRPNITGICTYFSGHVCSATGPNGEGSADYTTRGNVTGVTRYADAATPAGAVSLSSRYDIAGNAVSTTDARNQTATTTYGDGVCVGALCGTPSTNTFAFPVSSKTPKPDPSGTYGSSAELTSSAVYDFYTGLARSTTDANDRTTTLHYEDAEGNLDPLGRLRAAVRPDGGRTDYEYGDEPGNVYVRTLADLDGTRRLKSEQHFDRMGRPYRSLTWEGQDADNPWLTVDTFYDALGRAWKTSNPYRSAGPDSVVDESRAGTEVTFDALGRVTKVKTTADGAVVQTGYKGDRVLVTDQAGRQRISKTDAVGRLTEVWEVTPNDPSKYPGVGAIPPEVTAGLSASGHGYRTEYFYDALGNLRRVKQGTQQRFFAYDSLSRLVRARNPEQGSFTPDGAGGDFPALTDSTSGVGNDQWSTGYTYDGNGNLAKRRDARGTTTTYGYDALNRNVTVTYALGGQTAATPNVYRYYDNLAAEANGKGRLWKSEAFQTALTTVDKYDEAGRPKEQTRKFWAGTDWGPQAYTIKLTYNLAGGVTSQEYPSTRKVFYQYDAAGRLGDNGALPAFKGTLGDAVERTYGSQVLYAEMGGMSQERLGTQTPLYNKRFYNVRGQLSQIRVGTSALPSDNYDRGAIINHYSQKSWAGSGDDNNGNLRKQDVYIPDNEQHTTESLTTFFYDYDGLNRLDHVREVRDSQTLWTQDYDYDRWGNRTVNQTNTKVHEGGVSYTIPKPHFAASPATNRLGVPAGRPGRMDYDAAGNLVNDTYSPGSFGHAGGEETRLFDAENRMVTAKGGDLQVVSSYAYDADGRRVRRKVFGVETWQVYGTGGELLAEYAGDASYLSPQKEYGYRGGELLVVATGTHSYSAAAPSSMTAAPVRAGSSVSISLSWGTTGATKYRVERSVDKGWATPQLVGTTQATSIGDGGAQPGQPYLYRVCSADAGGACTSPYSNAALGMAYAFTDDPLVTYSDHQNGLNLSLPVTPIRAAHVTELRAAIDAVRVLAGLGEAQWAVPDEDLPGAAVHRSHVQEMRERLGEALQALGIPAPNYVDPNLGGAQPGTVTIKRKHFTDLREAATSGRGGAGSGGPVSAATGVEWLVTDQLGTPRMVVDQTGRLAGMSRHDYLPFGEELWAGAGGRTTGQRYGVADNVRQKFTGYERDGEMGLDYAQARYYSPAMGRFTSPDEVFADQHVREPQSWNLYTYTRNNPLRYNDPTGRGILDFFEKLKNQIVYGVWGDENDVRRMEELRRQDLLNEADDNGALIMQNISGQWVRIYPGRLTRAQVWAWSSLLYYYQETGGQRHELTPAEMAGVIDVTTMGRPALGDDPYHPDRVRERQDTELKALRERMQSVDRAAERLGFDKVVKDPPFNPHGQKVFTDGSGRFITRDIDSHSGGAWKMFNRAGKRLGTYDADLNYIGP